VVSATNLPAYGGGSETYVYDGDGRRVQKAIVNGPTTTYAYDIFGKLIAEYSSNPGGSTPPCGTCYISTDHLGSTRLVTGDNVSIIARHDYLPFGQEIAAGQARRNSEWGATDNVNQKFTGKERDQESGLDYFGARYMSSVQGRFTSPDEPLVDQWETNPQSWNLYAYGRNNPLRFADPTGQKCVDTSNGPADDGTGGGCPAAGVDPNGNIQPQQVNVNAQGGNQLTAFGLNLLFALSNIANDAFRFIAPNSQLLSNTPTNRELTGQLATGAALVGTTLIGPGGEASQAPREIKITWRGLLHVLGFHTGGAASKSFFGDSTEVTSLIKAAESTAPVPSVGGRFVRTVDAGRMVGTDATTG
jgi:RHS repeat-associated protein